MRRQQAYLALARGGRHLAQVLLLRGLRGVLCQLVEHIGAWRVGDVQVVGEGRAVRGGAGEGVLLVGLLCRERGKAFGVSGRCPASLFQNLESWGLVSEGHEGTRALGLSSSTYLRLCQGPIPAGCLGSRAGGQAASIPGLTVQIVQGHDDVQVSTQDLAELADQGRVIGWVNGHMVPRFIPRVGGGVDSRLRRGWKAGPGSSERGGLGEGVAAST